MPEGESNRERVKEERVKRGKQTDWQTKLLKLRYARSPYIYRVNKKSVISGILADFGIFFSTRHG